MTGQRADHDQTWRRFTSVTAGAGGFVLVIGMVLSYASLYEMAYNAGFDQAWITAGRRTLRPAHLFPLTLDVPVFVGYAGSIALAGRVSRQWAVFVLASCGGVTVAAQMVDEAGLVVEHVWVRALIHGWPPLISMIAAHLFVKIVQALGYLTPPAQGRARPSWPARAWAWVRRLRADIDTAPATATPGAWVDTGADIRPDIAAGAPLDIRVDSAPRADLDTRGGDITLTSGMSTPRGGARPDSAGGARGGAGVDTDMDTDASAGVDMPTGAGGRAGSNVTPMRGRRHPRAGVDTAPDAGGDAGVDIDDDARADIVARVRSGELSRAAAAREVGRHPKTVARWVADAEGAEEAAR